MRNGILPARVEPLREIEALVEFDGRGPGTDAERRAAEHLADRLGDMGREVDIEPIRVFPNWASTHAIFALLMVITSVVSVSYPFIGALCALLIAALGILDLAGTLHTVRRLTGRRSSQNVTSREEDEDKQGVIVLVAHYDANRTGAPFGQRLTERLAAASQRIGSPIGPFQPYAYSLMAIMICTILRMFGIQGILVSIPQFLFTVNLIVHIPALVDTAMSPFVPAANNNASGVVTVLRLAERYGHRLEHFNLWTVFAGAGEGRQLGMADWIKAHRGELDGERTVFICIDKAGTGTVRWHTREGYVTTVPFHETLMEYCQEIADEDEDREEKEEEETEEGGGDEGSGDDEDSGDEENSGDDEGSGDENGSGGDEGSGSEGGADGDEEEGSSDEDGDDEGDSGDSSDGSDDEDEQKVQRPRTIAEHQQGEGRVAYRARGVARRTVTEGHLPRGQQFPAITISSLNALDYTPNNHTPEDTADRIDEEALERVYRFCGELIEMIDERVGTEFEKAGEQTVLAEDE